MVLKTEPETVSLLVALLNSGHPKLCENAAVTLWDLSCSAECLVGIHKCGAVSRLIQMLEQGTERESAVAAAVLRNLGCNLEISAVIREAGGIPPLVRLLCVGTPRQKQHCAAALASLASCDGNKLAIRDSGGIIPLIELMAAGTTLQREHAAAAIHRLAYNPRNRTLIRRAGAIPCLVALLSRGTPLGCEHASAALGALAVDPDIKEEIRLRGAIRPLVALVANGSYQAKEKAAAALGALAYQSERNQEAIRAAGGIQVLCKLLTGEHHDVPEAGASGVHELNSGLQTGAGGLLPPESAIFDPAAKMQQRVVVSLDHTRSWSVNRDVGMEEQQGIPGSQGFAEQGQLPPSSPHSTSPVNATLSRQDSSTHLVSPNACRLSHEGSTHRSLQPSSTHLASPNASHRSMQISPGSNGQHSTRDRQHAAMESQVVHRAAQVVSMAEVSPSTAEVSVAQVEPKREARMSIVVYDKLSAVRRSSVLAAPSPAAPLCSQLAANAVENPSRSPTTSPPVSPPNCLPLTSSPDSSPLSPDHGRADGAPRADDPDDPLPERSLQAEVRDPPVQLSFASSVQRLRNFVLLRIKPAKAPITAAREESSLSAPTGLFRRVQTGLSLSFRLGRAGSSSRVSPLPSKGGGRADRSPRAMDS
jgi:hypothetical protein